MHNDVITLRMAQAIMGIPSDCCFLPAA